MTIPPSCSGLDMTDIGRQSLTAGAECHSVAGEIAGTPIPFRLPVEVDMCRQSVVARSPLLIESPQKPAGPRESFCGRDLIGLQRVVVRKKEVRARRSWAGDDD